MISQLPKTNFEYDRNTLSNLGKKLKKFIEKNQGSILYSQKNPQLTTEFQKWITRKDLQMLLEIGLIKFKENDYIWNFFPIFGDNLLLFCDFPSYNFNKEYVWLSSDTSRRSWRFFHSIPVKKGKTVLDLGTGSGLLAFQARQKECTAFGVDINPRAIQLAKLNRDLNNLDSVNFRRCSWKDIHSNDFDVIVSQPPFGISLEGLFSSYTFDGGGIYGLQATRNIIKRFLPKKGQILGLYVHSLENENRSIFKNLLSEWIENSSISVKLNPQGCLSLNLWWEKVKLRRNLVKNLPIPSEFLSYKEVVFYFTYLTRKD